MNLPILKITSMPPRSGIKQLSSKSRLLTHLMNAEKMTPLTTKMPALRKL